MDDSDDNSEAMGLDSDHDDDDVIDYDDVVDDDDNEIKKRSPFWQYFEEVIVNGVTYSRCTLCYANDKETKYKISGKCNGSSGNMKRHLESKHPLQFSAIENSEKAQFVFSQETFRAALCKWIVKTDQPFTASQEEAFIELLDTLNPDARSISDKTVRADIMADYEVKLEQLKTIISTVPGKISITMDAWTSKNSLPFLAIRGHWIDSEWNYESKLLDFAYIDGKHDGLKHSQILTNCLERLDIPFRKVLGITLDNAGNNDTLFNFLTDISVDSSRVRCLAHIINLAAQDMLASLKTGAPESDDTADDDYENETLDDIDMNQEIEDDAGGSERDVDANELIVKLRTLVRKIRKSVQLRQKLKKLCDMYQMKYLVPKIDVKTRWNSTFYMIQRAIYLAVPFKHLCSIEKALQPLTIYESDWEMFTNIQTILEKFERATKLVSMNRHCTIPSYLPTLNWLISSLSDYSESNTGSLADASYMAVQKLRKYELDVDISKLPFIATFINPAIKMNYFKEYYTTSELRDIRTMISNYFDKEYEPLVQARKRKSGEVEPEPQDELHAHMFKRSKVEKISSEMQKYIGLPLQSDKVDSLNYWKSREDEFPFMSRMARDFLPIQSGSVCVERDFSGAVDLITPTRCSLTKDTIRATMCLKSWYKD